MGKKLLQVLNNSSLIILVTMLLCGFVPNMKVVKDIHTELKGIRCELKRSNDNFENALNERMFIHIIPNHT